MNYQETIDIYNKAKKIVSSNLSWNDKYDLIFSDEISRKVKFNWFDTDTSYQEDVLAYMNGFYEHVKKINIINKL